MSPFETAGALNRACQRFGSAKAYDPKAGGCVDTPSATLPATSPAISPQVATPTSGTSTVGEGGGFETFAAELAAEAKRTEAAMDKMIEIERRKTESIKLEDEIVAHVEKGENQAAITKLHDLYKLTSNPDALELLALDMPPIKRTLGLACFG